MPAYTNIYCLSRRRDRETINAYIDTYVDRDAYDEDDEFTLLLDALGIPAGSEPEDCRDDEIVTFGFEGIIECALDHPRRSFTVYLEPRAEQIKSAIICFTSDDQVVFGLSIDSDDEAAANGLLASMAQQFGAHRGAILFETPPPDGDSVFDYVEAVETGCCHFMPWARH